jgi:AAA domain-containing protein
VTDSTPRPASGKGPPDPQAALLDALSEDELLDAVGPSSTRREQPVGPDATDRPAGRSRTLAEILTDPDATKPPQAVVPGLAWAGRITLVSAREGVGKSTLFAAAAAAVTTGGEFLGERCPQGSVLWVLVEEHVNDLVIRALKFQTAPDALYVLERPDEPLSALRDEVDRLRPSLVIIDTVHRFAASAIADASAGEQWAPIMTALDSLARTTNAAVLLSAQAIKATGDYRDSTEIGHGVDVVLNIVRPEKGSPVRRLEEQKTRLTVEDVVTFELRGDSYVRGGTVAKKLSKQRQRVLDALEPPMTFSEWQEASEGVPDTTFKRTLKYLEKQGYVRKAADGSYERVEGPLGPNGGHGRSGPEPVEGPPLSLAVGKRVAPTAGPDDLEERYGL